MVGSPGEYAGTRSKAHKRTCPDAHTGKRIGPRREPRKRVRAGADTRE